MHLYSLDFAWQCVTILQAFPDSMHRISTVIQPFSWPIKKLRNDLYYQEYYVIDKERKLVESAGHFEKNEFHRSLASKLILSSLTLNQNISTVLCKLFSLWFWLQNQSYFALILGVNLETLVAIYFHTASV